MKKSLVQIITSDGHEYGQVSNPDDLMKAQGFAHDRVSQALSDFVVSGERPEISGFGYTLPGEFNITISRPGRIYTEDGISYDLDADLTLAFTTADDTNPRLDLIVGHIEDDVDSEANLIPFVRLRTSDEFAADPPVQPYAPANIDSPTEKHWKVTPVLKTGTPALVPAVPAYADNEVPLYLVAVAPGVTRLAETDVHDLRDVAHGVRDLNTLVAGVQNDLSGLQTRVARVEALEGQPVDIQGVIRSLGEIIADIYRQLNAASDLPEIRYLRPKVDLTDPASSKIIGTGNIEGSGHMAGVPCVDLDVGGVVNFGASEYAITPDRLADFAARFVQVSGGAAHVQRDVNLVLGDMTPTASDGFTDFAERSSSFGAARSRPACAARDSQYIEVFGGLAADNSSSLSDWHTYDVLNDTLTPRTPSASLPASNRPAMFSYGDGTNVLLVCGDDSTSAPRWFRVNASTMVVTEITSSKPSGHYFFGDTLTGTKITIVALTGLTGTPTIEFWEYDTTAHTFTNLGVTGSVPAPESIDAIGGCYLQSNQMVVHVSSATNGHTYTFDRTSLQWTELNISAPYRGLASAQQPIRQFRMANVNGRPLLVGGYLATDGDQALAKVWEFKIRPANVPPNAIYPPHWEQSNATFPPRAAPGFCSTLGTDNLPDDKAFLFAGFAGNLGVPGAIPLQWANPHIFSSVQSGLIAVSYNGSDGVSVAPGSTFTQFEIPSFTADWAVAAFRSSFYGRFDPTSIKIEVSFDDGGHWHTISPDATFTVTDSATPGVRRVRITLYNNISNPPILTKMSEALDSDGDVIEDRIVVRFFPAVGVSIKALYMDSHGVITLEDAVSGKAPYPSAPGKALLHRITGNGSSAPDVKSFINRRRPLIKYTGTKASGTTPPFSNELAVEARYVNAAVKTVSTGVMYKIADPTVTFDDDAVTPAGVATNGDVYEVVIGG